MRIGIALIVRMFVVTSSPTIPSPRVAPRVNAPSSYVSEIARPSIFGSDTKRRSPGSMSSCRSRLWRRFSQARNSSGDRALARDSIGSAWRISPNLSSGRMPPATRWVGESGVRSSGFSSSIPRSSSMSAS